MFGLSRWEYCWQGYGPALFIALAIQLGFVPLYALLYYFCFRGGNVVTKSLMFVFYANSSTWAWGAYLVFHWQYCGTTEMTSGILVLCVVFLALCGTASVLDWCCAREGGYFRHQKTMQECIEYMNSMKETAPIHRVEIECYHYRTVVRTNAKGQTRTSRRRVTTYSEYRDFLYDRWDDSSDYPNLPEISMTYPIVAVESNFIIAPGDDYTLIQFDNFRKNFVEQNRYRDARIDETVTTILPNHMTAVTAKSEKDNEVPWWLHCGLFYFLLLLSCSCPLRLLFRSRSKQHTFEIRKLYYVQPDGPNMGNMGGNITVNVVDNKGEVNIETKPQGINMTKLQLNAGSTNDYPSQQQQQYGDPPAYSQGYPQAPGYQPINNPPPSAPPPYNPNMV